MPEEDGSYIALLNPDLWGGIIPEAVIWDVEYGHWVDDDSVLAWMPMPDPYIASKESENPLFLAVISYEYHLDSPDIRTFKKLEDADRFLHMQYCRLRLEFPKEVMEDPDLDYSRMDENSAYIDYEGISERIGLSLKKV